jgi:hypothetical protein
VAAAQAAPEMQPASKPQPKRGVFGKLRAAFASLFKSK